MSPSVSQSRHFASRASGGRTGAPVSPPVLPARYVVPAVQPSSVPGMVWPALPGREMVETLAKRQQLERSQWWPESRLRAAQFAQLGRLLDHAVATVPHYRESLPRAGYVPGRALTPELWSALPIIRRKDIQDAGTHFHSEQVPPEHGEISTSSTSGSTGIPLVTLTTQLAHKYYAAVAMLEAFWHRRDLSEKAAVIRSRWQGGMRIKEETFNSSWGPPYDGLYPTGPVINFDIFAEPAAQVDWLVRETPDYLLSMVSNLRAIAHYALDNKIRLPPLKEVRSYGEAFDSDFLKLCRQVWGAKHTSIYSTNEVGIIACQCPKRPHFHVNAELVKVEVLDRSGQQCRPGEAGRIVLTPLHNFAMPLIRYEIADIAEVGEPCPCGRGLPVLKRVLGRTRNLLTLPSGTKKFAGSIAGIASKIPAVVNRQVIQKTPTDIDVLLVTDRPLTAAEEETVRAALVRRLGDFFQYRLVYVDEIARNREGKFEDFKSEIPDA